MRKFLIISHGGFAKGIQHSISLFLGDKHPFSAISAYMDDTPVKEQIDEYIRTVQAEDELIILTDLKGGSVNQLMMPFLKRDKTFIIAGFNFPLLLELSVLPDEELTAEIIHEIVEKCKNTMELITSDVLNAAINEEDE